MTKFSLLASYASICHPLAETEDDHFQCQNSSYQILEAMIILHGGMEYLLPLCAAAWTPQQLHYHYFPPHYFPLNSSRTLRVAGPTQGEVNSNLEMHRSSWRFCKRLGQWTAAL